MSGNDLIQYWAQDPRTDVILLYLESFGNPRNFTQIARRVAREKPIVAVKAGRSKAGARAATSHTGALAASDAIVDALFHQAGVIRTNTLEELFDVAEDVAGAIERASISHPGKPVLAVCMSTAPTPTALASVPGYRFPEAASIALARAAAYGEWRRRPEGTRPQFDDLDHDAARRVIDQTLARGGGWLSPGEAQALVAAVRSPHSAGRECHGRQ